jgi:hypothetical protein
VIAKDVKPNKREQNDEQHQHERANPPSLERARKRTPKPDHSGAS